MVKVLLLATALSLVSTPSAETSRAHALVTTISVGTPPQELRCLLDSGSSDLWVPSLRCKSCKDEHVFHVDRSNTFKWVEVPTFMGFEPKMATLSYGKGHINGFEGEDVFRFGSVKVENQSFYTVEDRSLPQNRSWDGVCGLAWRSIAAIGDRPFYRQLQDQGCNAVIAIVPTAHDKATLHLGEIAAGAYKPDSLVWVHAEKVDPATGAEGLHHSFWVASGGLAIKTAKPAPVRFLIDTGATQALLAPPKYYASIVEFLLPEALFDMFCLPGSVIVCDCAITEQPGVNSLKIFLGGKLFLLKPQELFAKTQTVVGDAAAKEACTLQIQPNPLGSPNGLLGGMLGGMIAGLLHPGDPGPVFPDDSKGLHYSPASWTPSSDAPLDSETRVKSRLLPNGTVCHSKLVLSYGLVEENETRCRTPQGNSSRGEVVLLQDTDQSEQRLLDKNLIQRLRLAGVKTLEPSPMDDMWVLGGAFLERYVTVFDFDAARLGFAEPAAEIKSEPHALGLHEVQIATPGRSLAVAAWPAGACLVTFGLLLALGFWSAVRESSTREVNFQPRTIELEDAVE